MKKNPKCREPRCSEPVYHVGRCEHHYGEYEAKQQRRNRAVNTLHGESPLQDPALREEWLRLRAWWDRICAAMTRDRLVPELGDETQYATEWCITLAGPSQRWMTSPTVIKPICLREGTRFLALDLKHGPSTNHHDITSQCRSTGLWFRRARCSAPASFI
jgi:hypothetical protein